MCVPATTLGDFLNAALSQIAGRRGRVCLGGGRVWNKYSSGVSLPLSPGVIHDGVWVPAEIHGDLLRPHSQW